MKLSRDFTDLQLVKNLEVLGLSSIKANEHFMRHSERYCPTF